MGVLSCNRAGCQNVMCDNISHTYGYLCYECKQELLDGGIQDIEQFMGTKRKKELPYIDWYNFVCNEFKSRYEDENNV